MWKAVALTLILIYVTSSMDSVPSGVLHAEMSQQDGKLAVKWQQPEDPRRPIDGYMLRVKHEGEGVTGTEEAIVKPSKEPSKMLSHTVDHFSPTKKYNIGIAAFNVDPEDSTKLHFGTWIYVTNYSKDDSSFSRAKLMLIFSCTVVAIILVLFVCCLRKKRSRRQEVDMPMEAWEGPSDDEAEQ